MSMDVDFEQLPHFVSVAVYLCSVKNDKDMSKTIIQRMYDITRKMQNPDPEKEEKLLLDETRMKKAEGDLRILRKKLGLTTMQVIILTAILQNSAHSRIAGDDVAEFLGMKYLQFLTYDKDLALLRERGYVRIDSDGIISLPREALNSLKADKAVQPEPVIGLTTGVLLSRIYKLMRLKADDQLSPEELSAAICDLLENNPQTSLARAAKKYLTNMEDEEKIVFLALVCLFRFRADDEVTWFNIRKVLEEEVMEELKFQYENESLTLQVRNIIEYSGEGGMLDKEHFRIKYDILNEVLEDVGGAKKRTVKVSASRMLTGADISVKELFYNPAEGRQVTQLKGLLSEDRFDCIRSSMKEKGMRSGFNCLLYGAPGTGKTETVYQIARECGRDICIVDVSQIKSCWVGESEKQIKEVFDNYRQRVASGGTVPILLFNEADAIFGIRREGADRAVDKMENAIQNIILQEMEDLDGILFATTNLTTNLDKAFERRFLYKIRFDKPSLESRGRIWRSMLPELSEQQAFELSSSFHFSGGQIENIVRKKMVYALLNGTEPGFDQVRSFCEEEGMGESSQVRRIGF